MSALRPYSGPNTQCDKCAGPSASTTYLLQATDGGALYDARGALDDAYALAPAGWTGTEALGRECERCGYRWLEACRPAAAGPVKCWGCDHASHGSIPCPVITRSGSDGSVPRSCGCIA